MTEFEKQIKFNVNCVFGLYGAGGFGRDVMPLVLEQLKNIADPNVVLSEQVFFVETEPTLKRVHDINVLSEEDFFNLKADKHYFNVAVANSVARQRLIQCCLKKGGLPVSIFASDAKCYEGNSIEEGVIFCSNTMITSDSKVGKFFHANIYSYVEHDCVIGDYVTFAPRVSCNGHVVIEDHAYIGTGAVIRPGTYEKPLVIGEGAVVGMGAVVTKDVEAYTTVVGNPARVLAPKK